MRGAGQSDRVDIRDLSDGDETPLGAAWGTDAEDAVLNVADAIAGTRPDDPAAP
jgi:hypothetical protein